jgi:hypothetical protein
MTFNRQHNDLFVVLTRDRDGRIVKADLRWPVPPDTEVMLRLYRDQLYALIDDVAVADPDTWTKRFPPQEETEQALRRVADYFKDRAKVNRQIGQRTVANTFDLALTRTEEEIEDLYKDHDTLLQEDLPKPIDCRPRRTT